MECVNHKRAEVCWVSEHKAKFKSVQPSQLGFLGDSMNFTNLNAVAKPGLFFHRSHAAFWDALFPQQRPVKETHAIYMLLVGKENVQHNIGLWLVPRAARRLFSSFPCSLAQVHGLSSLHLAAMQAGITDQAQGLFMAKQCMHSRSRLFLIG